MSRIKTSKSYSLSPPAINLLRLLAEANELNASEQVEKLIFDKCKLLSGIRGGRFDKVVRAFKKVALFSTKPVLKKAQPKRVIKTLKERVAKKLARRADKKIKR